MSIPTTEPCHACGGPVKIVTRTTRRAGGDAEQQFRTCTNPDCRMNGPDSGRRSGDRI